ncbi:MAG: hypothetical protein R3B13_10025 [Polyangiaceae bacterium]
MTSTLPAVVGLPYQSRWSQLRARVALCLGVLAVCMALPNVAWALAPMCDESAQSIAAPFPLLPHDNGVLEGFPCDTPTFDRVGGAPSERQDSTLRASLSIDRVMPSNGFWLPKRMGERIAIPAAARTHLPREHRSSVYRPPRT